MLLAAWRLSRPSFAQAVSSLHPLLFFSHVVLPQDIAALLPKGKLLSEVRGRGRFMEGERAAEELPPPPCSLQAPPHFFFFFVDADHRPARPSLPLSLTPPLSLSPFNRPNGGALASSSPGAGCTTPFTGRSRTLCYTGE